MQAIYGDDSLDPGQMESNGRPVHLDRLWTNVQNDMPCSEEAPLGSGEIRLLVGSEMDGKGWHDLLGSSKSNVQGQPGPSGRGFAGGPKFAEEVKEFMSGMAGNVFNTRRELLLADSPSAMPVGAAADGSKRGN